GDREPASASRERGQMTAAATHVDQARPLRVPAAERGQAIEQHAEEVRALGGHLLRREEEWVLGLVDVLELGRGRQLRRQRALTARTPAIAYAAIDKRARAGGAAARGTALGVSGERLGPRDGRCDGTPGGHAAQRALELIGDPLPGVAA